MKLTDIIIAMKDYDILSASLHLPQWTEKIRNCSKLAGKVIFNLVRNK